MTHSTASTAVRVLRWFHAVRPRTLSLSVSPVIAGIALAYAETNTIVWWPISLTLLAAVAIQIGTNLYNDASDFERGIDTPDRLGPPRAAAQGWFSVAQVRQAAHGAFLVAFLLGLVLVVRGGWPILLLGILAIMAGYAYTSGARPIAYRPFGEVYVILFFGLAAVVGTYYLQTLTVTLPAVRLGIVIGLPAAAVLLLNNYRDFDTDLQAGRHTLCHVLGRARARTVYSALLIIPIALLPIGTWPGASWPVLLALPWAVMLVRQLHQITVGSALNALLGQTALYQLLLTALLCSGLLM
jgi:1,4-dihydroxy-2-naphthoate octaprenyltransferase